MGLIWLRHPVLWHSSRVPGEPNPALSEAEQQLIRKRWLNWYTADWDYAQTTVAFLCAGIASVFIFNVVARLRRASKTRSATRPNALDRVSAALRYASARQFHLKRFNRYSPPLAAILAVGSIFVFAMALMLARRPYYWPNMDMGHSAPLATRSGWISIAIMPFMIAFATKVNFVSILTGTSHEKLQVFHRWTAFIMYITSLVHTFPFIIGGIYIHKDIAEQWYTSPWYWTGVAALIPQTYLCFMSWGFFRNKYYETFKKLHFIAAGIFMAALFVHVNFRLTSWDYFWATLAIYGSTWLARILRTFYHSGLGLSATIEALPENMVRVTIPVPARVKWSPGQHVFVRFPRLGVHAFSSHPFTVASLPGDGKMKLVFRVRGGVTKALAQRISEKVSTSTSVLVDGPYGGARVSLKTFDRVLLLAGGTGATFILPVLMDLAKSLEDGDNCKRVDLVLAVREEDSYAWMEDDLAIARAVLPEEHLDMKIHLTRPSFSDKTPDISEAKTSSVLPVISGRPSLPKLIRTAAHSRGRLAVIACGPESFLFDVRNTVAECELSIADGFGPCQDLYLHTENYGW